MQSESGNRTQSITAKRMISGLVLKYLNGKCFVIRGFYKYTLLASTEFNLTVPSILNNLDYSDRARPTRQSGRFSGGLLHRRSHDKGPYEKSVSWDFYHPLFAFPAYAVGLVTSCMGNAAAPSSGKSSLDARTIFGREC